MEKTEQQRRLEAAGWECGWSHSVEKALHGDERRHFVIWATKENLSVRVSGKPSEANEIWANVYSEAKRLDPTGLNVPPPN